MALFASPVAATGCRVLARVEPPRVAHPYDSLSLHSRPLVPSAPCRVSSVFWLSGCQPRRTPPHRAEPHRTQPLFIERYSIQPHCMSQSQSSSSDPHSTSSLSSSAPQSTALHPSPSRAAPHSTAQIAPSTSPPSSPSLPELLAAWREKRARQHDAATTEPHSTAQSDTQSTSAAHSDARIEDTKISTSLAPSLLADMRSEMKTVAQQYSRQGGNQGGKKVSDSVGGSGENGGDYSEVLRVPASLQEAEDLLQQLIEETRSLASPSGVNLVAFSGGVDSSLAAFLLHRALSDPPLPPPAHSPTHSHSHSHSQAQSRSHTDSHSHSPPTVAAVIALSPSLSSSQLITARHVAAAIGIPLWEVETTEGQVPEYVANEGASCYACKATLYTTLYTVAQQSLTRIGMDSSNRNEVTLFNGTNADDLSDPSRLGLLAALHCRVVSPLARLPKAAVRAVARAAGLPNWDLAASPCLRSRLAFGVEATASTLMLVERAEKMVRSLLPLTPRDNMRVRLLHPTALPSPATTSTTAATRIPVAASPLQSPFEPLQSMPMGANSAPHDALCALLEVEANVLQQAEEQHPGIEAGMTALGLHYLGCRAFKSGSLVFPL